MILVALGSNLPSVYGSPEQTIRSAILAIGLRGIDVVKSSRIWITEPVPKSDQPLYRNAVIAVDTDLTPDALLGQLHAIEADFGRIRLVRNEARPLDLDLISYNDEILNGDVEIPHPRMHDRGFVLIPLSEVAPNWIHPTLKKSVWDLVGALPEDDTIRPVIEDVIDA